MNISGLRGKGSSRRSEHRGMLAEACECFLRRMRLVSPLCGSGLTILVPRANIYRCALAFVKGQARGRRRDRNDSNHAL